jgi:hypothetical protein
MKLVVFVQYFENKFLQIHNVIVDRCLDLEDITVTLYNAEDYTKSVSRGRGSVHQAFTTMWKLWSESDSNADIIASGAT